ncbi:MAG TPA: amidohydrolase family protein [Planctomycetota bacterium]|nr:amidohydrolase family protein [Planctomycetota bacterium]
MNERGRAARSLPAGGGRIAARFVGLDSTRHLSPGEVVWDARGTIVALRRARGPVEDLCVLPGLVDAHVHLQIAPIVGAPRAFVPWLGAVLADRAANSPAAVRANVRAALARLLAHGTTAVGEIDSTGASRAVLTRSRCTGRVYRELTGFHLDAESSARLVRDRSAAAAVRVPAGLSPHAPYSVSAALFRAAARACPQLAVHCAEVPEEQQFLRTGRGPFADLLARLDRLPRGFRAPGVGAVRWLETLGVLRAGTQLVHCQELERGDIARIAAAGATIAVCPGTIEWFARSAPPVESWLAAGITVALGTDSQASNASFSMRAELATAARLWPGLSPSRLLDMATTMAGAAIGLPHLGRLRRGGRADLVAVAAERSFEQSLARFVHGGATLRLTVARGRPIRPS